jgi:hypothetical protein
MKTTILTILFALAFTSLFFIGCEPLDEGTTSDDPRDKYVGEWQFIESFKSTEGNSYLVSISKDPNNSSQVILGNFGNPGSQSITVTGIVTTSQIIVNSQKMSNNWTIEGAGRSTNTANTTMSWTYAITAGGDKEEYTATATKQ